MSTLVEVAVDGERAAGWITLNRPERKNALSIAVRDEVSDALDALAADERVKSVVVTGAGDVFSAGFDLGEFQNAFDDRSFADLLWASSDRFHHALLTFPLPLVAAVNGPALAGGFDLAVCCDMRVAADTARFAHVEYTFGDVVYGPLREIVGGAMARELSMTGREIGAAEALEIRLVNRVVPAGDLLDAAREMTEAIAAAPRANLVRTKAKAIARAAVALVATLEL